MNIFLVDDNERFRSTLKLFLEGHLNHKVIEEASNGKMFLKKMKTKADIILMDINMPELNGIEATQRSIFKAYDLKIIAVSQYSDMVDINLLINVGFRGFVSKTNLFKDLSDAITAVSTGGYFFPEDLKNKNLKP